MAKLKYKTGASARAGDTVRNITTGQTATVICGTNDGRLVVSTGAKWEKWNVKLINS